MFDELKEILSFFLCLGLQKSTDDEIYLQNDEQMRSEYSDPVEIFPVKIDQLLNALNKVCE